nr:DUF2303 family protein [Paraburkholderia panacisoli]
MLKDFQGEKDAAAILCAGISLAGPQKSPLNDGVPFVVVPEGYKVEHLLKRDESPARVTGIVKLRDANSLVTYFNRQKRPESLICVSLDPAKILNVIDDHRAFDMTTTVEHDGANWRGYRVVFAVPASREWKTWTGKDRQPMTQLELAELIEDNLPDIVNADGSAMLSVALNFEASTEGNFVSGNAPPGRQHQLRLEGRRQRDRQQNRDAVTNHSVDSTFSKTVRRIPSTPASNTACGTAP